MLKAQNPSDLTTQLKTVGNLVDRETTALDDLKTARTLLAVKEAKVEDAKDEVGQKRKAAAEQPRAAPGAGEGGRRGNAPRWPPCVRPASYRADAALRAKHADQRTLRKLKRQDANGSRRMLAARAAPRRRPGQRRRAAAAPGARLRHLAVRLARSTRSTATGACTTAPTSTPPAAPRCAPPATARVISEYWSRRLGQPALPRPRSRATARHDGDLQPHQRPTAPTPAQRVRRGETVGYAGTTGWSTGCHLHFTVLLDGSPEPDELLLRSPVYHGPVEAGPLPYRDFAREAAGYHGTVVNRRCPG